MPTFGNFRINEEKYSIIREARLSPDIDEMYFTNNIPKNLSVKTVIADGVIHTSNPTPGAYSRWKESVHNELLEVGNKILLLNEEERERLKRDAFRFKAMERLRRILSIREKRKAEEKIGKENHHIRVKQLMREVSGSTN